MNSQICKVCLKLQYRDLTRRIILAFHIPQVFFKCLFFQEVKYLEFTLFFYLMANILRNWKKTRISLSRTPVISLWAVPSSIWMSLPSLATWASALDTQACWINQPLVLLSERAWVCAWVKGNANVSYYSQLCETTEFAAMLIIEGLGEIESWMEVGVEEGNWILS